MSDLKITFTLSSQDLSHLRKILRRAAEAAKHMPEVEIFASAEDMAKRVREAKPPDYVLERVEQLETIVAMVGDGDWSMPQSVRGKVITALAYFANPADLIPDPIPGLGFLDDAIMIEIVAQDLKHEIKGYREFSRFRSTAVQRPWSAAGKASLDSQLAVKRKTLRGKINAAQTKAAAGKPAARFRLW